MKRISWWGWFVAMCCTLLLISSSATAQVAAGQTGGQSNNNSSLSSAPVPSGSGGVISSDGTIPALIGLDTQSMATGIGAGYLGTLLGTNMFNRVTFNASGLTTGDAPVLTGSENPTFVGLLRFGTYLGVALTTILMMCHGFVMFFNKMEYGDVLGEAKDRFIGFTRGVLAFALVLPIAADGYSAAQHVVGYVAVASNGIGNKAANTVVLTGFGSPSSPLNVFSVDHEADRDKAAGVISEMVGQHSCKSVLKTLAASPAEVREICNALAFEADDFDVLGEADQIVNGTDEDYCWDNHSGMFGGIRPLRRWEWATGGDAEDAFQRQLCMDVRKAQRDAHRAIGDIYDTHGDLSSEAAQRKLIEVTDDYNEGMKKVIDDINTSAFGETYAAPSQPGQPPATEATTYLSSELSGFIGEVGWPGLGLIYTTIGSQMDAVTGMQGTNTSSSSAGFSIDRLQNAGRAAGQATRTVQSDQAMAQAAATSMDPGGQGSSGSNRSLFGGAIDGLTDIIYSGFEWADEGTQDVMFWLFSPVFEDPGPVATHKIGSAILGTVLVLGVGHDAALVLEKLPVVRNVARPARNFVNMLNEKLNPWNAKSEDDSEGGDSILMKMAGLYVSTLIMLLLLVATFLVMIIPKLPVFFVSFLALEWAIWCAIVVFASPLWVALNLTAIGNQPGLFTQRALAGLGILLYILLFPPMVVAAVVISVLAYNLIIPVLSSLLLMAFGGGIVETVLGILAMPFIFLLALLVGSFVSVSAISRIPRMITTLLGIQEPGDSVSSQMSSFVASPMQFNNIQSPQSLVSGGVGALTGKKGR